MDVAPVPSIERLVPRELGKDGQASMPWGHEWLLVHTPHYTLKRLEMRAGSEGPLQHHQAKDEAFIVHSGLVQVFFLAEDDAIDEVEIGPGEGFHIPPGATHKVRALEDSVLYEASTPHFNDRVSDEHLLPDWARQ